MNKKLHKYLQGRAVKGPWVLCGSGKRNYKAAIVIPALAESKSLPKTLNSLAQNPQEYLQQTLIIIVINNRCDTPIDQYNDNQTTINWLQENPYPHLNVAWVDASSKSLVLPKKEGVGLARKIGFDLALQQLDWAVTPLLISLDADTLVEQSYLPVIFGHFDTAVCGGATIPFRHQLGADPRQELAIRNYELYLRSYLFGLQRAGSPYAYHTIGSAFVCTVEAYIAAGGMNRRPAGEDFYFLQQLAKTSGVEMLAGTVVRPSARFSDRVPFGTGKAVQLQVDDDRQLFQFSSAKAFSVLQDWLTLIVASTEQPADAILSAAAERSVVLERFLVELNFAKNWTRLQKNHVKQSNRLHAFHCWFDALRTRQLLTRLDEGNKVQPQEQVAALFVWGGCPEIKERSAQLKFLEKLQNGEKR